MGAPTIDLASAARSSGLLSDLLKDAVAQAVALQNSSIQAAVSREAKAAVSRAIEPFDAATGTAVALANRALALPPPSPMRPGDGTLAFSFGQAPASFAGDPNSLPPLPAAAIDLSPAGTVMRVRGSGIVAAREAVAIEPGRVHEVRAVVRRSANPSDPNNDTVRPCLIWLDQGKNLLANAPFTSLGDLTALTTGSGRQERRAYVAASPAEGVTIVAPPGAAYYRRAVWSFGLDGATDIEVLAWADVTAGIVAPAVSVDFEGRLAAQESLNSGERLGLVEQQLGNPNSVTFPTRSDAMAAVIPVTVNTISLLGDTVQGDAAPRSYKRIAGPLPEGEDGFATQNGAVWQRVFLAATDVGRAQLPLFGQNIVRTAIRSLPLSLLLASFVLCGWRTPGDRGAGPRYVRGRGPMEEKDALGNYWSPDLSTATVKVGWFGELGIGNDAFVLQRANDIMAPYVFTGPSNEATNYNGHAGSVEFASGAYFITEKVRLNPMLRWVGTGPINEWGARYYAETPAASADYTRCGAALFVQIDNEHTYAIDTSPYSGGPTRKDDCVVIGGDIFLGTIQPVDGITIESLTIIGNGKCRGFNFAGCNQLRVKNCFIEGFIVNVRISSCWYGSMSDTYLRTRWRALIHAFCTDLALYNVNFLRQYNAVPYIGTDPLTAAAPDALWPVAANGYSAGIVGFWSNATGFNVTSEGFQVGFQGFNTVHHMFGVYVEGIKDFIIMSRGDNSAFGGDKFLFDTIVECKQADLIWSVLQRMEVDVAPHPLVQGHFRNLLAYVVYNSPDTRPRIKGVTLNPTDVYGPNDFVKATFAERAIPWTPELTFGGQSAGAQPGNKGRMTQHNGLCFAFFNITLASRSAATGPAEIRGLPAQVRAEDDLHGSGQISFIVGSPTIPSRGALLDVQAGGYSAYVRGYGDPDFPANTNLRGMVVYEAQQSIAL